MARFLAFRLEYRDPERTGNHVVNNARALCFAGQALGEAKYTDLALAVLRHDLPRLVTSEGFLREGSSHYHFLVTRWLLELLWLAGETGAAQLRTLVEPIAAAMVERCWFFLVFRNDADEWTMPLVGDVSPDCSWRWLIDLPWSERARRVYAPNPFPPPSRMIGWGAILGGGIKGETAPLRQEADALQFQPFPESGWYRLDWRSLVMIWHVEPLGAPPFLSHGHCDIGSFCFYQDGVEVLGDPGRMNYREDDPLGTYGILARAHNSVTIDGLEPFVYLRPGRYPDFYRNGTARVSWMWGNPEFRFSIHHTGFARLHRDPVILTRTFTVCKDRLTIEDAFEGRASHLLTAYFQWGPKIKLTMAGGGTGTFNVKSGSGSFDATFRSIPELRKGISPEPSVIIRNGEELPAPGGWYFPEYGERVETSSLVFSGSASLPCVNRYELCWRR